MSNKFYGTACCKHIGWSIGWSMCKLVGVSLDYAVCALMHLVFYRLESSPGPHAARIRCTLWSRRRRHAPTCTAAWQTWASCELQTDGKELVLVLLLHACTAPHDLTYLIMSSSLPWA
jgi:hypothetical protein